nr:JAB domain-containing protein [uncultured Sphingomonas sp.]
MRHQRAETPALLNGVEAARRFFAPSFPHGAEREKLVVAHVDSGARCIWTSQYDGQTDFVDLPIKTIIAEALRIGSSGIILAHNHPGGDTRPSRSDFAATRKLSLACDAIDLALLDHLILAGKKCASMRQMGYL